MNSIINQNLGDSNPIPSLTFMWHANFSDGTCLEQFENGIENRFQLVKDKFDKLEYFILFNSEKVYTVDLINGLIYFNQELKEKQESKEFKENIRLVYFRRNRVEIGEVDLKEKSRTINYHLGIQWNNSLGKNQKIILIIDSEGSFVVTGE